MEEGGCEERVMRESWRSLWCWAEERGGRGVGKVLYVSMEPYAKMRRRL